MLDPRPGEHIADLFCGLGNFTLALARSGARVTGVEGSAELVARAQENAMRNGLSANTQFLVGNLFDQPQQVLQRLGRVDGMLLDPPRAGAHELVKRLGPDAPSRLVYVSCNPATLARDAAVLVNEKGYRFRSAGVVNMFAHTAHVESMGVFERG